MAKKPAKKNSEKLSLKERMALKKKELKEKGGGGNVIFIKEGILRVRPLFCGEDEEYIQPVTQHYLGATLKGVYSPTTVGDPCAINERYQELNDSDDSDDKDIAKSMVPREKYMMPCIIYADVNGKSVDKEKSGRLVQLSKGLYEDIIDLFLDEEWGDPTDPVKGYDLKLIREGTGKNDTEYSVSPCKNTPAPKGFNQVDLPDMINKLLPSYEETESKIKAFLHDSPESDDDDDDEDLKKKKKKKKKKSKDV